MSSVWLQRLARDVVPPSRCPPRVGDRPFLERLISPGTCSAPAGQDPRLQATSGASGRSFAASLIIYSASSAVSFTPRALARAQMMRREGIGPPASAAVEHGERDRASPFFSSALAYATARAVSPGDCSNASRSASMVGRDARAGTAGHRVAVPRRWSPPTRRAASTAVVAGWRTVGRGVHHRSGCASDRRRLVVGAASVDALATNFGAPRARCRHTTTRRRRAARGPGR